MKNLMQDETDVNNNEGIFKRSLSDRPPDQKKNKNRHGVVLNTQPIVIEAHEKHEHGKVRFAEKLDLIGGKPMEISRESDEVAQINDMPWKKKQEFRTVTPFFKAKNKDKVPLNFHPVILTRSTEDLQPTNEILKPIPILSSKSYQDLSEVDLRDDKDLRFFQTRSIDDLLMNDIDGINKVSHSKYKMMKGRSSIGSLDHTYENLKDFPKPAERKNSDPKASKKPLPKPRVESKAVTKKLTFVLDKTKDEFVLENEEVISDVEQKFDEVFEDVCAKDDNDSSFFNCLVVDQTNDTQESKCFL